MNPAGTDGGAEWVELYSKERIDLGNFKLVNNDGDEFKLDGEISEYFIVEFDSQWLDNKDEKVILYDGDEKIDESELSYDSKNDDRTLQFCSGQWVFTESTKGVENNCEVSEDIDEVEDVVDEIIEDKAKEVVKEDEKEIIVLNKNVINLNPQQEIEKTGRVIYESKNEKIKSKAIYFFAGFLIFIIVVLLIWR